MASTQIALARLDSTVDAIDRMIERVNRFKREPQFSNEMREREQKRPDFSQGDAHVLSRLVALIAYSQQAPSDRVTRLLETPIFTTIFHTYSVEESARLSPDAIIDAYWPQLTAIRFKRKIGAMVDCAKCLLLIEERHGSLMHYFESSGLPTEINSAEQFHCFWQAFDQIQAEFARCDFPFFRKFTTLCHLLLDLGFDCAKPDSAVMKAAVDLGIVSPQNARKAPFADGCLRIAVQTIQAYAVRRGMRVPVIDQYFLIHGGQLDSTQFVQPNYYSQLA